MFALLFCLLRPYNKTVYAPRLKHSKSEKHAPPPLAPGVFGWVGPIMKTKEQVLVEKIGQDATVFLRFITMSRNIMIVLSVIGCGVYLPLNIIENGKADKPPTGAFTKFSPYNLNGKPVWVHVVVTYVFDVVICFFLWSSYRVVTRIRREYFESADYQSSLFSRTLMVCIS